MSFPLNGLRAFEASARHLSFTRAGEELSVTQAAVAAQVKNLEGRLGVRLFRRLPRGLALTDEGQALLRLVSEPFERLEAVFEHFQGGTYREPLSVAAVGTFAVGWLLPRLDAFARTHPFIDLKLSTHNNRIDQAAEGIDYAIRFGGGAWHGTHADALLDAPMSPMCSPDLAERLRQPDDLARETLLRSFRADEWARWFAAAGVRAAPPVQRGPVFDTSLALAAAAASGAGVALLPVPMFESELRAGRLVRPFEIDVALGSYWLTRLQSRPMSAAMTRFREWLMQACGG
jgi:LysR family transcriptional regulator of beta-lactamase